MQGPAARNVGLSATSRAVSAASGPAVDHPTESPGLVGRDPECAELERLLDNARSGRSGSLVVRGGAGMGKTALLAYAADRAVGMTVLRTTGIEAEYDLAFAGLHGLLRPIVDWLVQVPEPQSGALSAALGLREQAAPRASGQIR